MNEPSSETLLGMRIWGIEDRAPASRVIEYFPDGGSPVETRVKALITLQARGWLKREVDAVLAGRDSGIDGRPRGDVELLGARVEPPPAASIDHRAEEWQAAGHCPRFDELTVAEL
jgi:hypothetical protein